jgi:predicted phage terminase large subunit-like protein
MNRSGRVPRIAETLGLDPEELRGRLVSREQLHRLTAQTFSRLFGAENASEVKRLTKARTDLLAFTREMMPTYKADLFHEHLAGELTKVVTEGHGYVMIEAPPQHGKSLLVSQMLPPFWLGLHPDLPILLTSYGAERAVENSRNARAISMSPIYARLFGTRSPELAKWRANHWGFEGAQGYVYATGVGGTVTGLGFGAAVVDDPHRSWEDAQSETKRQRAKEWWQGTFIPRLWEGAPIFFITTRWNEDDLAGQVLAEEGTVEEGGRWKVLRYPALAEKEDEENGIAPDILGREPGEPLAPSRYSKKYLEETREIVGPMVWAAEWQQRPTRPEGFLFKVGRFEIKDADEVPVDVCRVVNGHAVDIKSGVRFWDLAATAKAKGKRDPDRLSGTLLSQDKEGHYWVLDQVLEQLDPEQVDDIIQQTADLDGHPVKIRMEREPGASGKLLTADYARSLDGFDFEDMPHSGDKLVFADPWAKQVNAGNVYLLRGPWNKAYMAEHGGFPNAEHDDQVDSSAGAHHSLTALKRRWRKGKFAKV